MFVAITKRVHHIGPAMRQIGMKCATDINVPLRMNCYDFGDLITFHQAAPLSQKILIHPAL